MTSLAAYICCTFHRTRGPSQNAGDRVLHDFLKLKLRPSTMKCIVYLVTLLVFGSCEHPSTCPKGYDEVDNVYCFKLLNEPVTFFEAHSACDVIDGHMVEITSQAEQSRVAKYMTSQHSATVNPVWMGATELQSKGTWLFMSSANQNSISEWSAWAPGYPRSGSNSHCAALSQPNSWKWINAACTYHQPVLCEVRLKDDSGVETIVG